MRLPNNSLFKSIVAALFSLCLLTIAMAQTNQKEEVKLPETPAGKTLGALISAVNTGKIEEMKRFHQERGGDPANADKDFDFYQQSGGIKLHKVVRSTDYEIEVLVQAKNDGQWLSFTMSVDAQSPNTIASIRVQPTSAPE